MEAQTNFDPRTITVLIRVAEDLLDDLTTGYIAQYSHRAAVRRLYHEKALRCALRGLTEQAGYKFRE